MMMKAFALLLLSLLNLIATKRTSARLEAAVILPHGDFALDPTILPEKHSDARHAANEIALAARQAGQWLSSHHVDPDLIFFSTPHGIMLSNDFAIYLGSTASGSATIGKDLHNASFPSRKVHVESILLEPQLSQQLITELVEAKHQNVSGVLVTADDSDDMPLHWAEVIPLLFLPKRRHPSSQPSQQQRLKKKSTSKIPRRHIFFSHPLRRYSSASAMVPELLHLGQLLFQWIEARPEKIAVVVSGDLSHTHRDDGPYGYSNASALFDKAVGDWATNPCNNNRAHYLLETARSLQPRAKSCAFTGLVLLHGMLCTTDSGSHATTTTARWDSDLLVNRNVTYYGMMVARYARRTDTSATTFLSSS